MQDLMAKYGVRITADAKTAPEVKKTAGAKAAGSKTVASATAAPPPKKSKPDSSVSEVLYNETSNFRPWIFFGINSLMNQHQPSTNARVRYYLAPALEPRSPPAKPVVDFRLIH